MPSTSTSPPPPPARSPGTHDDHQPPPPLAPLPIRPRPRPGETAGSYIRLLARANHLRPSYLRTILSDPPGTSRAIRPQRLATLSGRSIPALQHALDGFFLLPRRPLETGDDAAHDVVIHAARYRVHRRPAGHPPNQPRSPASRQLQPLIDAWLTAEPTLTRRQAWERLLDEHDTGISYVIVSTMVRNYTMRHNPPLRARINDNNKQ